MKERNETYIVEIKRILENARQKAYNAINSSMVEAYWQVGKRIVEQQQKGEKKAEYGEFLIKQLSKKLTAEFGNGFSERSLRDFRQFYITFPDYDSSIGAHCAPN